MKYAALSKKVHKQVISLLGRRSFFVLSALLFFLALQVAAYPFTEPQEEGICLPETETSGSCIEPGQEEAPVSPFAGEKKSESTVTPKKDDTIRTERRALQKARIVIYFFTGKGCPHCHEERLFLEELKKKYPSLEIKEFEVWYHEENASLLKKMLEAYHIEASGVPATFIGPASFIGFSKHSPAEIEKAVQRCLSAVCADPLDVTAGKVPFPDSTAQKTEGGAKTSDLECTEKSRTVYIPWIGSVDASDISLPVMTLIIAGMDSFNPCAFFVLLSLLGLLIHAQSRSKMLLIGGVFIFFSGFIYFLFMAAWLNLFLVMGQVQIITRLAGGVAVAIAAINIKDFFWFKKGVSLSIPDGAKPRLFDRMRKLLKSTSVLSILLGTAVLAVAANAYELLCTAGFPMVFTRILTLNKLSTASYYLYLVLYNMIYVVPMAVIVIAFTITLGKRQLTEWQGRLLKLVSGMMMLGLGGMLLFDPEALSNTFISFLLLAGALVVSLVLAFLCRKSARCR